MNKTTLILCALLFFSSLNSCAALREKRELEANKQQIQALSPGDFTFTLKHQNMQRMYKIHIPKSYRPNQAMPMVLSLHGGGGNMHYQADDQYYGMISKSESAGFIAVFPNGYSKFRGKLATWNAGICCGAARDKKIDDVDFIRWVIKDIKQRANVDASRIYANGMSNGGMMSYRLACELPEIKAIVSVAGTDGTQYCAPSKSISIFHIHALDDDRVLFNGGSGKNAQSHADFVSVKQTIENWVKRNSCDTTPERVFNTKDAYCDVYNHCDSNTQVKLCVTETGGHAWPGGHKPRGGSGSTAINATDLIWDFYQANP